MSSAVTILQGLNERQREAVECETRSLQIQAGPGSGKTKVLTSRVAWLVAQKKIDPRRIMMVTFTNKAANEMRQRLENGALLGKESADNLVMGTFHSICSRYLRRYGDRIGLKSNFMIADASASKKIMEKLHKAYLKKLTMYGQNAKPGFFLNRISKAKCDGFDEIKYERAYGEHHKQHIKYKDTILLFKEYEAHLRNENLVDFDNLLLRGLDLFGQCPDIAQHFQYVLVDEFQDTNYVQYELLKLLTAGGRKNITIVGDPDQSIYGWRSADITNFLKMQNEFSDTAIVNLEQNYRSTQFILKSAVHVVNKDDTRIQKGLFTENPEGVPMSLLRLQNEQDEANEVADEVNRIIKYSNGLIEFKDIAVLMRVNAMSRNFEQAFNTRRIPYTVVGGVNFLDRMEVKDIVSYLSFFYNPSDTISFERIINVPKRGIGEGTLKRIQEFKESRGYTIIEALRDMAERKAGTSGVSRATLDHLAALLVLYDSVQDMISEKKPIKEIIEEIVKSIDYFDHLKKTSFQDSDSRWDNVGELVTLASVFQPPSDETNAIGAFLESCMLGNDHLLEKDDLLGKVSISTIHAAKGLEWPCVFVIGCEEGNIPHSMTDDINEESRLLYVAMTRAQCFLYTTYTELRSKWGRTESVKRTRFFKGIPSEDFQNRTPAWNAKEREWVSKVLNLPLPEEITILEHPGDDFKMRSVDVDEFDDLDMDEDCVEALCDVERQFARSHSPSAILRAMYGIPPYRGSTMQRVHIGERPISPLQTLYQASLPLPVRSNNFASQSPAGARHTAKQSSSSQPAGKSVGSTRTSISNSTSDANSCLETLYPTSALPTSAWPTFVIPKRASEKRAPESLANAGPSALYTTTASALLARDEPDSLPPAKKATRRKEKSKKPTLGQVIEGALKDVGMNVGKFTFETIREAVEKSATRQNLTIDMNIIATETRKEMEKLVEQGALVRLRTDGSEKFAAVYSI